MWNVFSKLVAFFSKYFQKNNIVKTGPNTLEELLQQFHEPVKEKTQDQIINHYLVGQKIMMIELETLQEMPSRGYKGMVRIYDEKKQITFINLVPCIERPETMLRGFGKN